MWWLKLFVFKYYSQRKLFCIHIWRSTSYVPSRSTVSCACARIQPTETAGISSDQYACEKFPVCKHLNPIDWNSKHPTQHFWRFSLRFQNLNNIWCKNFYFWMFRKYNQNRKKSKNVIIIWFKGNHGNPKRLE